MYLATAKSLSPKLDHSILSRAKEKTQHKDRVVAMTTGTDNSSTLSVVGNQGLLASTKLQNANVSSAPSTGNSLEISTSEDRAQSETSLDFIGTGPAVKKLFSITLAEQPVCVAVHNIDGTLLIDDVLPEDDNDNVQASEHFCPYSCHHPCQHKRQTKHQNNQHALHPLPPSSHSLALALTSDHDQNPDATKATNQQGALPILSRIIQKSRNEQDNNQAHTSAALMLPTISPPPVREYVEWKFQDMNLLVGSDALVVRPESGDSSGVVIRVEEVNNLRRLLELQRLEQQEHTSTNSADTSTDPNQKKARSYADALLQPPNTSLLINGTVAHSDETDSHDSTSSTPLNLDQVQLQTCIVPTSGPLGGWLRSKPIPTTHPIDSNGNSATQLNPSDPTLSSPKCVVLDAYLDNLMANVPQLALCLQEKGLIQSVKLIDREQIPAMMMHSTTLDTSKPVETVRPLPSEANDLFSPEIMEMNATALLRFLKANCTNNNTTYLLRTNGSATDGNNIQLYDISSISQQRQKKWIWWLATMSYRFALRLRQLESHDVLPVRQRAFRDRQRSLLQTTLDLLQDLRDMDGNAHESLVASVREHIADTFLGETLIVEGDGTTSGQSSPTPKKKNYNASPSPVMAAKPRASSPTASQQLQHQPYSTITTDALNKAQDHLLLGIKALWPILKTQLRTPMVDTPQSVPSTQAGPRRRKRGEGGASSTFTQPTTEPSSAMVSQLFGLNFKVVNVTLRLAEHYLRQYSSSSAMQSLRHAARRMVDSISLLEYLPNPNEWIPRLRLQYTWLWEHCGHFARSFASDDLWRERGHASGDDVLYVLRDVQAAFGSSLLPYNFSNLPDPIRAKTKGIVSLQSLSALYSPRLGELKKGKLEEPPVWEEARTMLSNQGLLQRDKRQVLVASCISYNRAIAAFQEMTQFDDFAQDGFVEGESSTLLNLLRQRLGDACNETGKVLLASLRVFLAKRAPESTGLADVLLDSAQFWFLEGLEAFETSADPRNIALLRCNLCQCCKLRANASFSSQATLDPSTSHAEVCLEKAVAHLQAAHETLGTREADPMTWDMVSDELAATFLVLAVRRRQSLLGGGATPVVLEALRLSPGKERSIIEPMEKALAIYQQSGNLHQAAAVQYQLALTNSKVWTCQRDEAKTREKLSAAFTQYQQAFAFFASHLTGNEPTFVLLCLDIASLYAAVSGEECLVKALMRCLDTVEAFSPEAIDEARYSSEWLEKMETLASSVDDRVFKLLRNLVKIDSGRWKDLYREGLSAKMACKDEESSNPKIFPLRCVHDVIVAIRKKFYNENETK